MKFFFKVFLVLIFGLFSFSSHASESVPKLLKTLPKIYEDKGACPFECCTYREWTALQDLPLYEQPHGEKTVGSVKKGEKVKGVTGIVYSTPTPVEIIYTHGRYKKGDRIYLLTYLGEGFYKIWHQGKVWEEEMTGTDVLRNFCQGSECPQSCANSPSKSCWATLPGKIKPAEWWVQIKTSKGALGWTPKSEQFSGQDSCG
ncbi:MAG: hypothetical protein U1F57_01235 [bacterium]